MALIVLPKYDPKLSSEENQKRYEHALNNSNDLLKNLTGKYQLVEGVQKERNSKNRTSYGWLSQNPNIHTVNSQLAKDYSNNKLSNLLDNIQDSDVFSHNASKNTTVVKNPFGNNPGTPTPVSTYQNQILSPKMYQYKPTVPKPEKSDIDKVKGPVLLAGQFLK